MTSCRKLSKRGRGGTDPFPEEGSLERWLGFKNGTPRALCVRFLFLNQIRAGRAEIQTKAPLVSHLLEAPGLRLKEVRHHAIYESLEQGSLKGIHGIIGFD